MDVWVDGISVLLDATEIYILFIVISCCTIVEQIDIGGKYGKEGKEERKVGPS